MVKLGSGFTKTAVEWKSFENKEGRPEEICQETLLIIDVGAWSELERHTPTPARPSPALESIPCSSAI